METIFGKQVIAVDIHKTSLKNKWGSYANSKRFKVVCLFRKSYTSSDWFIQSKIKIQI